MKDIVMTNLKNTLPKVLIYCVRGDHLLVFRHMDAEPHQIGIQVPGGEIRPGQDPLVAGKREAIAATGEEGFAVDGLLGETEYDLSPGRMEIEARSFVLAHPVTSLPKRWVVNRKSDGARLEYFWLPLTGAHVLQAGQGALIGAIADFVRPAS